MWVSHEQHRFLLLLGRLLLSKKIGRNNRELDIATLLKFEKGDDRPSAGSLKCSVYIPYEERLYVLH